MSVKANKKKSFEDWVESGHKLRKSSDYEKAIRAYDHAIKLNQSSGTPYAAKGLCLAFLGKVSQGKKTIDKAIKIDPKNFEVYRLQGLFYYDIAEYNKALNSVNKSLKLNSKSWESYANKSRYLDLLNRIHESLKVIEKAIKIKKKNDGRLLYRKGNALLKLRRTSEASKILKKSLIYAKDNNIVLGNIARGFSSLGQMDLALSVINQAIKKNPKLSRHWLIKSSILSRMGKYEDGLKAADHATKLDPDKGLTWLIKSQCYGLIEDYKSSLITLEHGLRIHPKDSSLWGAKSIVLKKFNLLHESKLALKKSIQLDPENIHLAIIEIENLIVDKKYPRALLLVNKAIKSRSEDHQNSLLWVVKSDILSKLGKYNQAIAAYEKSKTVSPVRRVPISTKKLFSFLKSKNMKKALNELDKIIKISAPTSGILKIRSYILSDLKRYGEAIKTIKKAISLNPTNTKINIVLGYLQLEYGKHLLSLNKKSQGIQLIKNSLKYFDKIIEVKKEFGPSWYNKACGHSILNQIEQAKDCMLLALLLDPDSKKLMKNDIDLKNLKNSKQYKKLFLH